MPSGGRAALGHEAGLSGAAASAASAAASARFLDAAATASNSAAAGAGSLTFADGAATASRNTEQPLKSIVSRASRHVVLRFEEGESLPEAILDALREHGIATGWLRASGIVSEAEIKAFRSDHRSYGTSRRIAGPLHVIALEGSIGMARGQPSAGLRTIVARETESGLETISGELTGARIVAVEAIITALDDVACARALDDRTSTWLLDPDPSATPAPIRHEAPREREPSPEPPPAWAQAVAASAPERDRPATSEPIRAAIPQRPQKPSAFEEDIVFPEAGDIVEHFAFGRCEVLKSDGDRLHLKVGKDGRIREIALEMLRVSPLESNEEGRKRFKLDRKL